MEAQYLLSFGFSAAEFSTAVVPELQNDVAQFYYWGIFRDQHKPLDKHITELLLLISSDSLI